MLLLLAHLQVAVQDDKRQLRRLAGLQDVMPQVLQVLLQFDQAIAVLVEELTWLCESRV